MNPRLIYTQLLFNIWHIHLILGYFTEISILTCLKLNIYPLYVSPPSFFLISVNSNSTQPIILPFLPSSHLSINSNVCMLLSSVYTLSYSTSSIFFFAITLFIATIISQEVSAQASKMNQDRLSSAVAAINHDI